MAKGKKTGGRKVGSRNKVTVDIRALAQVYGQSAVDALASIMEDSTQPPAARVGAARELLDRGYGKPPQSDDGKKNPAESIADALKSLADRLPG